MGDEVGIRGERRSCTGDAPLTHGTPLTWTVFLHTLTTILTLPQFSDMALNSLFGDLALDFA